TLAPTDTYTLSLHDALPISPSSSRSGQGSAPGWKYATGGKAGSALYNCHCSDAAYAISAAFAFLSALMLRSSRSKAKAALIAYRSEEHTSELQSRFDLVCRL